MYETQVQELSPEEAKRLYDQGVPFFDVREVEEKLLKAIPAEYLHNAHHWLILHGRYVCKALKPECPHCLINDLCEWPEKTAG